MKALIQRVTQASVTVDGKIVGQIDDGLLVLLGVAKTDTPAIADRMLTKLLNLRIFQDAQDKMNLSVLDKQAEFTSGQSTREHKLLVVSQFTLYGDTKKGNRPSFNGAGPQLANELYEYFVSQARQHLQVETGVFAADMKVDLRNDGPVTFMLECDADGFK